jgi:hypothetical protein
VHRNLPFVSVLLYLLSAVLPACADSRAPTLRIDTWPEGYVELIQGWHFHAGDNPAWAQPDFDDSSWPAVSYRDHIVRGLGSWYVAGMSPWIRDTSQGAVCRCAMRVSIFWAQQWSKK